VIVEGYLDMIIPFSCGIKNIVASSGTALTIEQIQLWPPLYYKHHFCSLTADKAGADGDFEGDRFAFRKTR